MISEFNDGYKKTFPNFKPWFDENNFVEYIKKCEEKQKGIGTNGINTYTYFIIDRLKLIGICSFRINPEADEEMNTYGGHISYSTSPKYRKEGYRTIACHLLIKKCLEYNLDEIMIMCDANNIASQKIIEKNFGSLKDKIKYKGKIANWHGQIHYRYIVNTKESIIKFNNKYRDIEHEKFKNCIF